MRRLLAGSIAIGASLGVLVAGGWFIGRGAMLGIPLLILGLLGFVIAVATTLPQSTQHARDE